MRCNAESQRSDISLVAYGRLRASSTTLASSNSQKSAKRAIMTILSVNLSDLGSVASLSLNDESKNMDDVRRVARDARGLVLQDVKPSELYCFEGDEHRPISEDA